MSEAEELYSYFQQALPDIIKVWGKNYANGYSDKIKGRRCNYSRRYARYMRGYMKGWKKAEEDLKAEE